MCILFSFLMNAGCQSSRAASLIGFYSMEWRIQSLRAVQCQANSLCWSHIPLIYLKLQKLKNSITRAEPWMYLEVSTNILHRISSPFRSCVNFSKLRSLAKNTPPTERVSEGNKKLQKCPAHNNNQIISGTHQFLLTIGLCHIFCGTAAVASYLGQQEYLDSPVLICHTNATCDWTDKWRICQLTFLSWTDFWDSNIFTAEPWWGCRQS